MHKKLYINTTHCTIHTIYNILHTRQNEQNSTNYPILTINHPNNLTHNTQIYIENYILHTISYVLQSTHNILTTTCYTIQVNITLNNNIYTLNYIVPYIYTQHPLYSTIGTIRNT